MDEEEGRGVENFSNYFNPRSFVCSLLFYCLKVSEVIYLRVAELCAVQMLL